MTNLAKEFTPDSLDDLLGERTGSTRAIVTPPASYQPQSFTERCRKCGGSGRIVSYSSGRVLGACFACKGRGSKTFKSSPAARAAKRASTVARKARKAAEVLETFKAEYPDVWAWMDGSTYSFAVTLRAKLVQYGSLTENQIAAARGSIAKLAAAREAAQARVGAAPAVDTAGVDRLKAAFDKAIAYAQAKGKGRDLKNPRITIGAMVISPAKATSTNPGALYVKAGGQYLGKIAAGKFFASRECSDDQRAKVLAFLSDPKAAAEAYGIETGMCCICNATLTNKASIERGIGPICADKFGW